MRLVWEKKIDELGVGKSVEIEAPRLRPMNVDRAWGQILVAKAESIDLLPSGQPAGLRPIDPQQDVQGAGEVRDAALAFEFHDDWSLRLIATRYQLEEMKHTAIERAVVRMVVVRRPKSSPQKTAVQALYRMRSARQRLALRLPRGASFDTAPLRINGAAAPLERGGKGDYSIPLVGRTPDEPFLVELRYTVDGGEGRLDCPEFPSDPAVQKVYLCVYLPEEMTLLGYRGPWSREPRTRYVLSGAEAERLASWVREGVASSESTPFPTDGRLYVFSTLRPPPPPDGSLRLIAFYENWVHGLVFAAFALVGVVMLPRSLNERLIDADVLTQALPPSILQAEPDGRPLRPIVDYYAPKSAFRLSGRFEKPAPRLQVTTNLLLLLDPQRQEVRGGFALLPETERLFALDFSVPPGWRVAEVTDARGAKLAVDRYEEEGGGRVHIRPPRAWPAGRQANVYFHAVRQPPGWLDDWTQRTAAFPVFSVQGASQDVGAGDGRGGGG